MKRRFFLKLTGGAATLPFVQLTPLRRRVIKKHIEEKTLSRIALTTIDGEIIADFDVDQNFPAVNGEMHFTDLSTTAEATGTAEKLQFFDKKGNFICDGDICLNTQNIGFDIL